MSLLGRAEAIIKQFAGQELQVEKEKIIECHAGSGSRITGYQADIGSGNGGAETEFPDEVEKSERKLELWESKSKSVENEIRLLKTPGQLPAQRKPVAIKTQKRQVQLNKVHLVTSVRSS